MTLALAIDTTNEHGSIALADEEKIRREISIHAPQGFSQVIFQQIEALLTGERVDLNQIGIFAGASGPGSFTGVRVGLSAIKGLAEVKAKKAIAISNLKALAAFGKSKTRAVIIDARRGEIYAAVYDDQGNEILNEQVLPLENFLKQLPTGQIEWISQGLSSWAPEGSTITEAPKEIAGAIAQIALRSTAQDPAALEANYVRRSDAEIFWKEA